MALGAFGADDAGAMTLREAAAKLDDTLAYAELVSQAAPPGHAIFQAIADAQEARSWVDDQIPFWSTGDSPALPTVSAKVNAIVSEVYDAAATVETSPDQAVPPTTYVVPAPDVPWVWLGVAAAGIIGAALYFRRGWR